MLDYSAAPPQSDWSEMIPNGTLARGLLFIRHYNADMGLVETPSKTDPKPGARQTKYLDCLIKILDGPYSGRQIFTKIGTDGSEKYVDMGRSSIRAILEYGRGASPTNMIAYQLADYGELDNHGDGIQVGIKVKLEPAKGEYGEKNDVSVFLSPVGSYRHSRARVAAGCPCYPGSTDRTGLAATGPGHARDYGRRPSLAASATHHRACDGHGGAVGARKPYNAPLGTCGHSGCPGTGVCRGISHPCPNTGAFCANDDEIPF